VGVGAFDDPFAGILAACSDTIKPVGVGALDDPFVGILAACSNTIKPVGVGALDDPFLGAFCLSRAVVGASPYHV